MAGESPVHLAVTLHPEQKTVTGVVQLDGGELLDFRGWMGLMAAMQNIVDDCRAAGEETSA